MRLAAGIAKSLEEDRWLLLAAYLPIGSYPSVVVEAVAKHPTDGRAKSEGTLRSCGHVREHVPDAPLGTQRRRVPLFVIEHGETLSEVEHLITFCHPHLHVNSPRCLAGVPQ